MRGMPCVIRKRVDQRTENLIELAGEEWDLFPQIEALLDWLGNHSHEIDPAHRWIADVGFCGRADARGGGPVIMPEVMRLFIDANMELWLSEYPAQGTAASDPPA